MAWIAAHWVLILTIWTVTHTIAQTVHAKCPPTTWYGKAAAVWSALNPLDVVKALNSLGSTFAVPLAPIACFCLLALSCTKTPTNPPPAYVQAKATTRAAELALARCAGSTALGAVLSRQDWEALTINELASCNSQAIALVKAAWDDYKIEQAALAAAADAGLLDTVDSGHD